MKKFVLLICLAGSGLWAMEKEFPAVSNQAVAITTSDHVKFQLSLKDAQRSDILATLLKYFPREVINLELIPSEDFQKIKDALEAQSPQEIIEKKMTFDDLIEFIKATDFFMISDLRKASIKELCKRKLSQDQLNSVSEKLAPHLLQKFWKNHPHRELMLKLWSLRNPAGGWRWNFNTSPDRRYWAWPHGKKIKIFDAENDFQQIGNDLVHEPNGYFRYYILSNFNQDYSSLKLRFSPDGKFLVSVGLGILKAWSVENNFRQVGRDLVHKDPWSYTFSSKGNFLVSTCWDRLKIWDAHNNFRQVGRDLVHEFVYELIFSPDGKYLISRSLGRLKVWDAHNNFRQVGSDLVHKNSSEIALSFDGKYLVSFSNRQGGTIKVWDAKNNFNLVENVLDGMGIYKRFIRWDMRRYWTFKKGNLLEIRDANSDFQLVGDNLAHDNALDTKISPDEKYLISRSLDRLKVWDAHDNFRQVGDDLVHKGLSYKLRFSPDGKYLISRSSDRLKVWDAHDNFRQVDDDLVHKRLYKLRFSPDGRFLASAGSDRLKVWDAHDNFRQVDDDLVHKDVVKLRFSPDGKYLISISLDRLKFWNINKNIRQISDFRFYDNWGDPTISCYFFADERYVVYKPDDYDYATNIRILSLSLFEQIMNPLKNQKGAILLFLRIAQLNEDLNGWDPSPVQHELPIELQEAFAGFPADAKAHLKKMAPQFKDAFKRVEEDKKELGPLLEKLESQLEID